MPASFHAGPAFVDHADETGTVGAVRIEQNPWVHRHTEEQDATLLGWIFA